MLHGFDVSAYQGTGVPTCDFIIIKATEGKSYTSSKFKAQYTSAKTNAKHRGAYHFARPEESSYKDQVKRFLDTAQPKVGESVWLDLEASKLTQAETNAWARGWGDTMWDQAPGVTSGSYLGSGYVSNNTGRDLSKHFDLWWYPQYSGAYQVAPFGVDLEELRAENRSSLIPERRLITTTTTAWPPTVTPWLPSTNNTGWKKPDLWQFTDNWRGLDASITTLTIAQLAGGQPAPIPKPIPAPKVWPGRYLKLASPLMHGSDVTWTQQHLNTRGSKLTADGQYGPKTRDAVKAFQKAKRLTVDGIVGKATWTALGKS